MTKTKICFQKKTMEKSCISDSTIILLFLISSLKENYFIKNLNSKFYSKYHPHTKPVFTLRLPCGYWRPSGAVEEPRKILGRFNNKKKKNNHL